MTRIVIVVASIVLAIAVVTRVTISAIAAEAGTEVVTQLRNNAQEDERRVLREACSADFYKFCASVQPGGGRVKECLMARQNELSPTCRGALQKAPAG